MIKRVNGHEHIYPRVNQDYSLRKQIWKRGTIWSDLVI